MYKICEYCRKEFKTRNSKQKCCCRLCGRRLVGNLQKSKRKEKECEVCGNLFYSKNKNAKFCSVKCQNDWQRKVTDKECPVCGKVFHQKYKEQKYCCRQCAKKDITLPDKTCPSCGKKFHPHNFSTVYCSLHCSVKGQRNNLSLEQREEKMKKLNNTSAISLVNKEYANKLSSMGYDVEFEFRLNGRPYDLRIGNILIEINPYPFHNSTWAPNFEGVELKGEMYHYDKYYHAINSGYRCIMVRDWTNDDELIAMIKNNRFHYEGPPRLNYYNPDTNEHIISDTINDDLVLKGFIKIYDCGTEIM